MEKHQQIEAIIEERIRSGIWKVHGRLPPERQLAQSLGVSRNTLRTALQVLQGKGILASRRGGGTTVLAVPGQSGGATQQDLYSRLAGMAVLFPPMAAFCAVTIKPDQLLELETRLSSVGLTVHTGSAPEFAKAQRTFLRFIVDCGRNEPMAAAAGHIVPHGKFFSEALARATMMDRESLFAGLAGILGGIRRAQSDEARQYAGQYVAVLSRVCRA